MLREPELNELCIEGGGTLANYLAWCLKAIQSDISRVSFGSRPGWVDRAFPPTTTTTRCVASVEGVKYGKALGRYHNAFGLFSGHLQRNVNGSDPDNVIPVSAR